MNHILRVVIKHARKYRQVTVVCLLSVLCFGLVFAAAGENDRHYRSNNLAEEHTLGDTLTPAEQLPGKNPQTHTPSPSPAITQPDEMPESSSPAIYAQPESILSKPIENINNKKTPANITSKLASLRLNVWEADSGKQLIEDNAVTTHGGTAGLHEETTYKFSVSWEMPESSMINPQRPEKGDYFEIKIRPEQHFNAIKNNGSQLHDNNTGEHLADWKMDANLITCTLTQLGAEADGLEGMFGGYFTFSTDSDGDVQFTLNETAAGKIPGFNKDDNGPGQEPKPNEGDYPYSEYNPNIREREHKNGNNPDDEKLYWYIRLNDKAFHQYAAGKDDVGTLENYYMEDELEQGQRVTGVSIETTLCRPKDAAGNPSSQAFYTEDLTDRFQKLNTAGKTNAEVKQEVRDSKVPCIGVTQAGDAVYIKLGNVPGNGLEYNQAGLSAAITSKGLTNAERDVILSRFGANSPLGGQILTYYITLTVDVFQTPADNNFANDIYTYFGNGEKGHAHGSLSEYGSWGEIETLKKGEARLTKKDEDTGAPIQGAVFMLQTTGAGGWKNYAPVDGGPAERSTDKNGVVLYKKLEDGKYRFLEVKAASGYDLGSLILQPSTFEIKSGDKKGIDVAATNKKKTVNPTPQPTPTNQPPNSPDATPTPTPQPSYSPTPSDFEPPEETPPAAVPSPTPSAGTSPTPEFTPVDVPSPTPPAGLVPSPTPSITPQPSSPPAQTIPPEQPPKGSPGIPGYKLPKTGDEDNAAWPILILAIALAAMYMVKRYNNRKS